MSVKKIVLLAVFMLSCCGLTYASELTAQEASNYFNEGVKFQNAANFMAANSAYTKTLFLDPKNERWQKYILNNRGVMCARVGDFDSAEQFFVEALKIDPDYRPAQLNLGLVYEGQKRSKLECIEYWLKALNINLEELKPKIFAIQELQKAQEKKK